MKTTSALIDITSVTEKNGIFEICYWDENCENENNVTIQISKESLLEHIELSNLNSFDGDEGYSYVFKSPSAYLQDHKNEVIKEYIQFNS